MPHRDDWPPPMGFRTDPGDRLTLRIFNSAAGVTVGLRVRLGTPDEAILPMHHDEVPTTDRVSNFFSYALHDAELLSLSVQADAGTPRRGQTFVQVGIARGGDLANQPSVLLVSDYLQPNALLGWPGGTLRSSLDGPGVMRTIVGTDPAAGVELSETVPTNARWRLISIAATLVTNATAANRRVNILLDDGTDPFWNWASATDQTASQTIIYNFAALGLSAAITNSRELTATSPGLQLFQGWRFRTLTTNLQAGDNWGAPVFAVEEWIEE